MEVFNGTIIYSINGGFSVAMFDYQIISKYWTSKLECLAPSTTFFSKAMRIDFVARNIAV
jgi:hypothetical protein